MAEPNVYILTIRGSRWLNENDRWPHWAPKAQLIKEWRESAGWASIAARVPRIECARIQAYCLFRDHRKRDAGNWYPTIKAAIDGITDHRVGGALITRVFPDDDSRHVDGPHMYWRCEPGVKMPTLELHITPLEVGE